MELKSCLNSFIPIEYKAKQVMLGFCRLNLPTFLPKSPHHTGQDAALATYPGLIQTGYHQTAQREHLISIAPVPTKISD